MNNRDNTENNVNTTIKKENKVKLLICYHKPSYLLKDNVMTPIHVGRANAKARMGEENKNYQWLINHMIGDDTGENISDKNDYYNEMTAVYWAWKNYEALGNPDYVGLMHYRRHFIFDEKIKDVVNVKNFDEKSYYSFLGYDEQKMSDYVDGYDFIAHIGNVPNVYQHYIRNQRKEDLDRAIDIVLQKYPDYKAYIDGYFNGSESNFCNMCIFSKKIFFEYCEWIFSILEEFEKQVDMTQKRFFISERLTGLFIYRLMQNKKMKYKTLPIAFLEEPANVPIAIYAEKGEELTTAVNLYSILNNKGDYNSYSIYVFCEKERGTQVEQKIEKYIGTRDKCTIQVVETDDTPDVLPLVLDEYLPKLGKCIYIWGKILTLHDLGEFFRICSVDDYMAVGVPRILYDPAESNKVINPNLLVLNLKRFKLNHVSEKVRERLQAGEKEELLNKVLENEIGYIHENFFVSEHLANYKESVLPLNVKRGEIQNYVLWHVFMVYDEFEPEFNVQGIFSQFWWDNINKIPYEFQKIQVAEESFRSLIVMQQYEINAYDGIKKFDPSEVNMKGNNEEWRNYGFFGKLKFYYVNNGLKQTLHYALQKMTGRAK